ncbi:MAG: hypothetical protein LBG45_11485 [Dysgonamonadaceae bacterium]|jgi:hypothetical protein|nr:hypothetical protein [Dysgonamonadaceae bacterium]
MAADIVLSTINAKWIHPSLALRLLKANLGEYEDRCKILEGVVHTPEQAPGFFVVAKWLKTEIPRGILGLYGFPLCSGEMSPRHSIGNRLLRAELWTL